MSNQSTAEMNQNQLVKFLNKLPNDFTKADIIRFIRENNIRVVNFRYVGGDGRLKTLNIVINSMAHLDQLLSSGERVDGSSLFPYIEAGSSDLYVIPRYKTAFVNPFSEIPAVDILCSYYNKDGDPLEMSPEYVLRKAHESLKSVTGYRFEAMGELEYYIISEKNDLFTASDQKGYHESFPFSKWEHFRTAAMLAITQCGGNLKYGHSEVGNFSINGLEYEQNEIEFSPVDVEDAADQLLIAKWVLRSMAYKYGITLTLAPKITTGKAGSGLHFHTRLMKDTRNLLISCGTLTEEARKLVAGYLTLAPSLTAFGNTNPTSYFRLVPHQEAPTNICWGDRNRSVLVRVPLGWCGAKDMVGHANPSEPVIKKDFSDKQTIEFRCPDGSADIYLTLAGLVVAARHGFEMDNALEFAKQTYVDVNIFDKEHTERASQLSQLPVSCAASADMLELQSAIYQKYNVFPASLLKGIGDGLRRFNDADLRKNIAGNEEEILKLVNKFFHCG